MDSRMPNGLSWDCQLLLNPQRVSGLFRAYQWISIWMLTCVYTKRWHIFRRKESDVLYFSASCKLHDFGQVTSTPWILNTVKQCSPGIFISKEQLMAPWLEQQQFTESWDVEQKTFISLIIFIMDIIIVAGPWNTRTFHWVIARYIMALMVIQARGFSFYWPRRWCFSIIPLHHGIKGHVHKAIAPGRANYISQWEVSRLRTHAVEFHCFWEHGYITENHWTPVTTVVK